MAAGTDSSEIEVKKTTSELPFNMAFNLLICFDDLFDGLRLFLAELTWDVRGGRSPKDDRLCFERSVLLPLAAGDDEAILLK